MNFDRPNPDAILAQVQAEAAHTARGKLKVFFGYAAGVGKTFAMLEAAQRAKTAGREVVVGYVQPHGRQETEALLAGLETLPLKQLSYQGVALAEFDVDAALARHPELLLVDELAHTNAPGSRHAKRWQDLEELLEAGIDVWTTLNVQHIESLNDVIGQITGITVRETVPDRIFDLADDLELIDLTPEELLARLRAGKVYIPEQAQRAMQNFFQRVNLVALRELSLRQAARRVHTDLESARRQAAARLPWATADRLLVCVGPSPTTSRVIRTAKRMAAALDAPWLAVAVERPGMESDDQAQAQITRHFRLAEKLGAETLALSGEDVADTILEFARSRNVTKIFVGKTNEPRHRRWFRGTVVGQLLQRSGGIDVYVIQGEEDAARPQRTPRVPAPVNLRPYGITACILAASALVAGGFARLGLAEANCAMVFLAAVAIVAYRYGRGPAILASVGAVLIFDFFFVRPYLTFAVDDTQYVLTFGVMLAIGLMISTSTSRLKRQAASTALREQRLAALYHLSKQLGSVSGELFIVAAAGRQIADLLGGEVVIYRQARPGPPTLVYGHAGEVARHPASVGAASWVIANDQMAGAGTDTLPGAIALFVPLSASQETVGALGVRVPEPARLLQPDQRQLLEALASQLALALERDAMALEAADALVQAEAEQIRSSLLSSVSHDLKTPLAAIAGASSSLARAPAAGEETRRLAESIYSEATRLNRLLENILQMSKLESGASPPNQQWHVLEEIVGSALRRMKNELSGHPVTVRLSDKLPLVFVDGLLLEQLLANLLDNVAQHTPPGTPVSIAAEQDGKWVALCVADSGPGLPPGQENRVFEKFYQARAVADAGRGTGLGLAICRAIAQKHGGTIRASSRPGGGAEFIVRLPLRDPPPSAVVESPR